MSGRNSRSTAGRTNPYARPDHFTKAAKNAGYPARSVFKLEEIDKRCRLLKPGQRVLDLGAAPGSWAMYAAKAIGKNGRLLAIDLVPLTISLGSTGTAIVGDAFEVTADVFAEHGPFDVVLSDMAPATSGTRDADQARSFDLVMRALEVAQVHGKDGSSFVAKIFMGPEFEEARKHLREAYREVRGLRPESVRTNSKELFLVAMGKGLEKGRTKK